MHVICYAILCLRACHQALLADEGLGAHGAARGAAAIKPQARVHVDRGSPGQEAVAEQQVSAPGQAGLELKAQAPVAAVRLRDQEGAARGEVQAVHKAVVSACVGGDWEAAGEGAHEVRQSGVPGSTAH